MTTVTVQEFIVDQLKKHGLPMLLLAAAVFYLHGRQEMLEKKVENCQGELIRIYQDDRKKLIEVVRANTSAIEKLRG
jgi:hypothetical protein